jgi:hypothetical protein
MKCANVKTILGDLYNELIAKESYFNIIIYCKKKIIQFDTNFENM